MHTELQERILRAVTTCTERLHRRQYRQIRPQQPNQREMQDHGPQVIGAQLNKCLEQLTNPSTQRTPGPKHVEACRQLLSEFIESVAVEPAPTTAPSQDPSFPMMLEQRLRPAVHRTWSIGLTVLRAILRLPRATTAASAEAWDRYGFRIFFDLLSSAYPEPSPDRSNRIMTNARLLAYVLSTLENASTLDDLLPLKKGLAALAAGAVPVAYDQGTKTLYLGNWYH